MDCFRYRYTVFFIGIAISAVCTPSYSQAIDLVPVGHYRPNDAGEGTAEVICYHAPTQRVFSVNGKDGTLDVISLSDPSTPQRICQIPLHHYGSVPTAVTARDDLVAACLLGATPAERGRIVFISPDASDSSAIIGSIEVGWHPDMLSFSPDGRYLVVANEGEPSPDGQHDGEGSVSVIAVPDVCRNVAALKVRDAHFRVWDRQPLPTGARRVQPDKPTRLDVEPEAIAISADSTTAFVTLQENNAVAVVDLASATLTRIIGLGHHDHSRPGNEIDVAGQGDPSQIRTVPLLGMLQPDNVAWFQAAGRDYLVLANEGDARDNDAFHEEIELGKMPLDRGRFPDTAMLQSTNGLDRIVVSRQGDIDGDRDLDELYTFGSRSITIIDVDGTKVFDSGSQIEHMIAQRLAREAANGIRRGEYRTKRGPEPEGLVVGQFDGRTLAFVGLERDSGIIVFDVTRPAAARCVAYVHPSEAASQLPAVADDVGPEGLVFVSGKQSPTGEPLLLVANEASGSITIYAVRSASVDPVASRK